MRLPPLVVACYQTIEHLSMASFYGIAIRLSRLVVTHPPSLGSAAGLNSLGIQLCQNIRLRSTCGSTLQRFDPKAKLDGTRAFSKVRVSSSPARLWLAGTAEVCGLLAFGYHFTHQFGAKPRLVSVLVS